MISRNRNRKDKRLWTDHKGGEKILYVRAGDEIEEADFITRAIREAQADRTGHDGRGALPHQRPVARD